MKLDPNLYHGFVGFLSVDGKPISGEKQDLPTLQVWVKRMIADGIDHRSIHVNDRWSTTVGEVDADGRIVQYVESVD